MQWFGNTFAGGFYSTHPCARLGMHSEDVAAMLGCQLSPLYVHLPMDNGFGGPQSSQAAAPQNPTTLMIRNLPRRIRTIDFVTEINRSGFKGSYDFVYVPCTFKGDRNQGFAFVNFHTPEVAATFEEVWHKSQRLGMKGKTVLTISAADTQGFYANVAACKENRVNNAEFRPLIFVACGVAPSTKSGRLAFSSVSSPTPPGRSQSLSRSVESELGQMREKTVAAPSPCVVPIPLFAISTAGR